MVGYIDFFLSGYNYIFYDLASPVTRDWFLLGTPHQLVGILILYVYFCRSIGPWYMANKKPYNLKSILIIYNSFQVITNALLFYQGFLYISSESFSFVCTNVEDPSDLEAQRRAAVGWVYMLLKVIDLLDTIFFVLRKSYRQITFLHLHHHILMAISAWYGLTYIPGGQSSIIPTINSFVHIFTYFYYLIAGLGDGYKKYTWWKRHVTELQLIQFTIFLVQSANSIFYDCGYPTWAKISVIFHSCLYLKMFGTFYYNNYIKRDSHNYATESNLEVNKENSKNERYDNKFKDLDKINDINAKIENTEIQNDNIQRNYATFELDDKSRLHHRNLRRT